MSGVEECDEIRAYVRDHEAVLARGGEVKDYTLRDTFFRPTSVPEDEWWASGSLMRLRDFGERGSSIIFSRHTVNGPLKAGTKFRLMEGEPAFLGDTLASWGFTPEFSIRRLKGHFLDVGGFSIALEEIENLGWMTDVHIEPEQLEELKAALGLQDDDLLRESLPEHYRRLVLKK